MELRHDFGQRDRRGHAARHLHQQVDGDDRLQVEELARLAGGPVGVPCTPVVDDTRAVMSIIIALVWASEAWACAI